MSTIAKFSVREYERLIALGALEGEGHRRVELIRGELHDMTPIGTFHADVVDRLTDWSYDATPRATVRIRVQNPLAFLPLDSEPQPDIVWAKRQDYGRRHPAADDVLLLIDVAESSLASDRGEKALPYADAGVQEYWIANLIDRAIEVHRDPAPGGYRNVQSFAAGQFVQPLSVPEARFGVAAFFEVPQ